MAPTTSSKNPLSMAKLLVAIRNALETAQLKQENIGLKQAADGVNEPVGRSPIMQTLRDQIKRIAQHDTSVLIIGESGSGRAVCARYLHELSSRRAGPFIRVPIAGLTHDGLSAELFGVESGEQLRFGSLEQAGGGTLFLEDVADMDSGVQARLFSALEHQSFTRVDGLEPVRINVRVIAATSRDPAAAVDYGRLHEDLYYHLNVVSLAIPPLRGHREDIPELLSFYIDLFTTKEILPYRRFTVGAQNRMRNYDWPGNVRELKNMVNRLLILGSGADIDQEEIDLALGSSPPPPVRGRPGGSGPAPQGSARALRATLSGAPHPPGRRRHQQGCDQGGPRAHPLVSQAAGAGNRPQENRIELVRQPYRSMWVSGYA